MTRRKLTPSTPSANETVEPESTHAPDALAHASVESGGTWAAGDAPAEPGGSEKPGPAPHIRSWTRDHARGYQILTDDRLKLIVLRFDERPTDEVLEVVKAKGFKYRELREHGRVWTVQNDWEGRTLMDQLDQELRRHRADGICSEPGVA